MKPLKEQSKVMARRLLVSLVLSSVLPLTARHPREVRTQPFPQATHAIQVSTDTVVMPGRASV